MTELPDKRYFRPDELAKIIEQREQFVRTAIKRGLIKHVDFGPRKTFIPREEVERIIQFGI